MRSLQYNKPSIKSSTRLIPYPILYTISQRTLMRAVAGNLYAKIGQKPVLTPVNYHGYQSRNMAIVPLRFKPIYSQKDNPERNAQDISYHEGSHIILYDDQTDKIVGLLTSAKRKNLPDGVYIAKVSCEKYDGTFIPKIDPSSKAHMLDSNGNLVPDPNKGGQFLAVFPLERILSAESKGHLLSKEELESMYPNLKSYIEKYQATMQNIIIQGQKLSKTKEKFPKKLGGKDDEPV